MKISDRTSKRVRNLLQTIVIDYIDYNSFIIDYNYEQHNIRKDSKHGAWGLHDSKRREGEEKGEKGEEKMRK